VAVVVVPLLRFDALPEPGGYIRAFFVEPLAAPPHLLPAPPARGRPAPRASHEGGGRAGGFIAPIEVPTEIGRRKGLDLGGIDGGVAGEWRAEFRARRWGVVAACPTRLPPRR